MHPQPPASPGRMISMNKATSSILAAAAAVILTAVAGAQSNYTTPYTFGTLAGSAGAVTSVDATGAAARFHYPSCTAVDANGNVYVADTINCTIRKVTPAGVVTTLAGSPGGPGSVDGTGAAARFNLPQGVTVDASGNLFVADTGNATIRKVTPAGVVTTLAGTALAFGNRDGTGAAATFHGPCGIGVDSSGNLYVADTLNDTVRMVTAAGVVTTLAGSQAAVGSSDGTGAAAQFNAPYGVAVDGSGNLYVSDQGNNTIRKIASGGVVTTLAGTAGHRGSADGTGAAAQFFTPAGVAVDGNSNVYVADNANDTIRKITPAGVVTTLAGTPGTAGSADGSGGAAQFNGPVGVASDLSGNLYIADQGNNEIRTVSPGGASGTLAGARYILAGADGTGINARFLQPAGTATGTSGNVYVADTAEDTIRKITPGGVVTTLAGTAGIPGYADGTGPAARFRTPEGVAVDASGNIYVTDTGNNVVRKVTPAGVVTTLAGSGASGYADGSGSSAQFNLPVGIVFDGSSSLYVTDQLNAAIRKVTLAGVVTTFSGAVGNPGSIDGSATSARFNTPSGIAIDGSGNLYVADTVNYTVRKVSSSGAVTTLAGTAAVRGTADGTGAAAAFYQPFGVAVDSGGNVYVTDTGNDTIRKVTSGGAVTTIAGVPGVQGSVNGTGTAAQFFAPAGISADSGGNLYVADSANNVIRKISPSAVVTTLAGTVGGGSADGTGSAAQFNGPAGVAVDASGNLYVTDQLNQTIRKVTPAGVVTTLAGKAGDIGSNDGTGAAAQFYRPFGLCVDPSGNVYVADSGNHTVRKITPAGVVTTLAGTPGHTGSANGTGSGASFNVPVGIALDGAGNLYVSEQGNFDIRKITPGGTVTTFAGTAGGAGNANGTGPAAQFNLPAGLAVDAAGNVYVADYANNTIRKITPASVVTTFVGNPQSTGSTDGPGASAKFYLPTGIAVDASGNLYVAEQSNNTIRMITPAGVVSTLAGFAGVPGSEDGTGPVARFFAPTGVAVDAAGNVYVADEGNNTIRKGSANGAPQIQAPPTDQYTAVGGSATFSVTASGSGTLTYQWAFNGAAIGGATGSSYTVTNAQASNDGAYTVTVTNADGSVTSSAGNLYVNTGSSGARLINIATRALVGTGGNVLIPGFVVGGSGSETVLIRATGPALTAFGVSGVLAQPSMLVTAQSDGHTVATNTGWGTNANPAQIASVAAQVGAFALTSGSADCAVIVTLQPGGYTVQVSGVGNTTGVALAEVYEVSYSGTARLVNIATRAQVGTGGNILIPGFVIGGTGVEQLLVRADGPSLTAFGVSGVLAQPSLTVTAQSDGHTIGTNTGWGTNTNPSQISSIAASVGAFALTSGSADSALIVNLPPGGYTMQISGVGGTTGVGLAEVYEVP